MTAWLNLLRQEVAASTIQATATRLGVSRTAVSLVLSDKYPAKTDRIAQRVIDVLGAVDCPVLGESIPPERCHSYRCMRAPTHNPIAMRHWRACQRCPNNPVKQPENNNADR